MGQHFESWLKNNREAWNHTAAVLFQQISTLEIADAASLGRQTIEYSVIGEE